ncbi:MAG: nucleotidyltransferase domain-containing protein [Candidatus Moraniibacteriota bacterium]
MEIDNKKFKKEASELGIKMVILFGSRASGKAQENSDYDIAILTSEEKNIGESMDNYSAVLSFLSRVLNVSDGLIDLTNLNKANPLLAYEVLFQGKMLYGERNEFDELRARSYRYFVDAKPLFDFEAKMSQRKYMIINQALQA